MMKVLKNYYLSCESIYKDSSMGIFFIVKQRQQRRRFVKEFFESLEGKENQKELIYAFRLYVSRRQAYRLHKEAIIDIKSRCTYASVKRINITIPKFEEYLNPLYRKEVTFQDVL